ncbi:MAG: hypothetical protein HYR73_08225 [Candidatus Eisenbacteria bacterium]|nr:hypothetical protein [Candidatus Eisenbacteria bacterium]
MGLLARLEKIARRWIFLVMGLLARLEKLDRRWIFLVMALLVLGPLIWPVGLKLTVSRPVQMFADAIDAVPEGSTVLMSCDYDPASRPELVPMTKTALRQLWNRHCKVVVTVLWPGGPGIVDETLREVAAEPKYRDRGYGYDWVNLGYKAGNEAVMVLMGQGLTGTFPQDYEGHSTTDFATLPIMKNVRNYASFPLLVNISAGYPGTKEWVQQVNSRFHLPMVSGCTAVSAPEYYPYLQSGQLRGLLGGMAGAAEYEKARGEGLGPASRGMDAQSLAHVFVAFCIVLGNLVQRGRKSGGAA